MYHVSNQDVDECIINVIYYYYYLAMFPKRKAISSW